MNNLIIQYWDSFLAVAIFIIVVLLMIKRGATKQVKEMLFYLVTEAEKSFGGGTGALKYAAVTTWLYERLPAIVKFLFTAKQIDKMIEQAVKDMKDYLDKNISANLLVME